MSFQPKREQNDTYIIHSKEQSYKKTHPPFTKNAKIGTFAHKLIKFAKFC